MNSSSQSVTAAETCSHLTLIMASSPTQTNRHNNNPKPTAHLLNSLSLFSAPNTTSSSSSAAIRVALFHHSAAHTDSRPSSSSSSSAAVKSQSSSSSFASTKSNFKGAGPAFVGQVFSMCDLSGTGLMAVSTHFDLPFISQRTPEFLKKIFASVTSKQRDGPVFRFFVDLGDAVTYVKRLNIPSGVVGACRLDLAYEHFKEKPHMFQFVPNEKQVKEANKLLKTNPKNGNCKRVDGVPVFSAQNLDIAIATEDGIKWYTPYFFDKNMLDNILETSVDRHFHSLIQTRHIQRQRDMIDENLGAEVSEEMGDKLWEEPPEVDEAMDEIGIPEIPLSVISKAAEMQLHYTVDKVLLGNRWLRKATGIQPQFPYMVDTFERRSAASFLRASKSTNCLGEAVNDDKDSLQCATSKADNNNRSEFPSGNLFSRLWSRQKPQDGNLSKEYVEQKSKLGPHFPKITMIGISTAEAGPVNKASVKKTMDDLLRELEQTDSEGYESSDEFRFEDRDPLFVSNVGDSRWKVR